MNLATPIPDPMDRGREGRPSPEGGPGTHAAAPLRWPVASPAPSLEPVWLDRLNAESPPEALASRLTPTDVFFVRSHFPIPATGASPWTLTVSGEVRRPRRWSLAELEKLPSVRVVATLECAGNSRRRLPHVTKGELPWGDHAVGSAVWEGVPLSALLEEAQPLTNAREVVFSGADEGAPTAPVRQFSRSLRIDLAEQTPGIVVATKMNGRPLPNEHGRPARLVVPGWYGMAWVKWLSTIEVREAPFQGYYQASRYVYQSTREGRTELEPVSRLRVKSLVVAPTEGERLTHGRATLISGKAWSGSGPVTKVEVDVGSGWQLASVSPGEGPYDWVDWTLRWTPTRIGRTIVRVRATDTAGETQPEAPPENDFQYGTNSIQRREVVVA